MPLQDPAEWDQAGAGLSDAGRFLRPARGFIGSNGSQHSNDHGRHLATIDRAEMEALLDQHPAIARATYVA